MRPGHPAVSLTSARQAILEEEAEIERLEEWWLALGLSTAPADRPGAERAIADLYRAVGLAPPGRCLWAPSPLQGAAGAMMAQFLSPWMPARVREMDRTRREVLRWTRDAIAQHGADGTWELLGRWVLAAAPGGVLTEPAFGATSAAWGAIRARLGQRFGAEGGERLGDRLAQVHGRRWRGPSGCRSGSTRP